MLDFCPFESDPFEHDFRKIDLDNLAYELIFMGRNRMQDLEMIIGEQNYISKTTDEIRQEDYLDESIHYYLEASFHGEPSGLEKLLNCIDGKETGRSTKVKLSLTEATEDGFEHEVKTTQNSRQRNLPGKASVKKEDKKIVYRKMDNGTYVFSYMVGNGKRAGAIMKAVPCCPSCHNRLPIGWLEAEDFCPIDFMGKTGGGKTTLLLSMMANDWDAFSWFDDWIITPAHELEDDVDYFYTRYRAEAECMTTTTDKRNFCYCPENTQRGVWVPEVFLMAEYNGHKMMVGLYDNSGENLAKMQPNDPRLLLLSNMYAHIYLIEPKQMRIALPMKTEKVSEQKKLELLSIEEQGRFQEEHAGEIVLAKDLLRIPTPAVKVNAPTDTFQILRKYQTLLAQAGRSELLEEQHLCATLIKCDLLEELDEIKMIPNSQFLFERGTPMDLFRNKISRQKIVKNIFDEYVSTGLEKTIFEKLGSTSYHCVSAIGCDTEKKKITIESTVMKDGRTEQKTEEVERFVLNGPYNPIRVAEPLMECLQQRAARNKW